MSATWQGLVAGLLGLDWSDRKVRLGLDPYLIWADLTEGAYLARNGERWRVATRWKDDAAPAGSLPGKFEMHELYNGKVYGAGFVTRDKTALNWLRQRAWFELAEPGLAVPCDGKHGELPQATNTIDVAATSGPKVIVGVIDGVCGWANARFRNGKATRIQHVWDQGSPAAGEWAVPKEFGYGREIAKLRIDALLDGISEADIISRPDEETLYKQLGVDAPSTLSTHGTAMLDIAAGLAPGEGDVLEKAGIIYVQLPTPELRDTGGNWTAACVLDALHYIVQRSPADARIVVNLSLASHGGPHDGSSTLEEAIDHLIEDEKGRLQVVIAAGNAHEERIHRRLTLSAKAGARPSGELKWDLRTDDATEAFLEVWLPPDEQGQPQPCATVTVTVPGCAPARVGPGEARCLLVDGKVVAAVLNMQPDGAKEERTVPNGHGGFILVAAGMTANRGCAGQRPLAPNLDFWTITVENEASKPIAVEAWAERRDVTSDHHEAVKTRPAYTLVDGDGDATLGSLANGEATIVVGAYEDPPPTLWPRSAAGLEPAPANGPAWRRPKRHRPDVNALASASATDYYSGTRSIRTGTSVAAAQVTRRLASQLIGIQPPNPVPASKKELLELLPKVPVKGMQPEDLRAGQFFVK